MRLTTESIQQALLILMRNKPFGDITVSEVIRRAGVSRSAFYRHYASKKDILLIPLQKATQEIYAYFEPGMLDGWRRLFRTVADNSGMIRVFLEAGLEQEMLRTADGMLPHDDRAAVLPAMWDGLIFNTIIEWASRSGSKRWPASVSPARAVSCGRRRHHIPPMTNRRSGDVPAQPGTYEVWIGQRD